MAGMPTCFNGAAADQSDVSSHYVFWNTGAFAGLVKVLNAGKDAMQMVSLNPSFLACNAFVAPVQCSPVLLDTFKKRQNEGMRKTYKNDRFKPLKKRKKKRNL